MQVFLMGMSWNTSNSIEEMCRNNVYTIKTAALRGALRVLCDFVSVDAMPGIRYDDRGI